MLKYSSGSNEYALMIQNLQIEMTDDEKLMKHVNRVVEIENQITAVTCKSEDGDKKRVLLHGVVE